MVVDGSGGSGLHRHVGPQQPEGVDQRLGAGGTGRRRVERRPVAGRGARQPGPPPAWPPTTASHGHHARTPVARDHRPTPDSTSSASPRKRAASSLAGGPVAVPGPLEQLGGAGEGRGHARRGPGHLGPVLARGAARPPPPPGPGRPARPPGPGSGSAGPAATGRPARRPRRRPATRPPPGGARPPTAPPGPGRGSRPGRSGWRRTRWPGSPPPG